MEKWKVSVHYQTGFVYFWNAAIVDDRGESFLLFFFYFLLTSLRLILDLSENRKRNQSCCCASLDAPYPIISGQCCAHVYTNSYFHFHRIYLCVCILVHLFRFHCFRLIDIEEVFCHFFLNTVIIAMTISPPVLFRSKFV